MLNWNYESEKKVVAAFYRKSFVFGRINLFSPLISSEFSILNFLRRLADFNSLYFLFFIFYLSFFFHFLFVSQLQKRNFDWTINFGLSNSANASPEQPLFLAAASGSVH
jgi:hypothetical protein